ncbi:MAG: hypothetical protein AVDCRST_MAG79-2362, partial [uncultured Thermoleophilia bacterium]
ERSRTRPPDRRDRRSVRLRIPVGPPRPTVVVGRRARRGRRHGGCDRARAGGRRVAPAGGRRAVPSRRRADRGRHRLARSPRRPPSRRPARRSL